MMNTAILSHIIYTDIVKIETIQNLLESIDGTLKNKVRIHRFRKSYAFCHRYANKISHCQMPRFKHGNHTVHSGKPLHTTVNPIHPN